MKKIMKLKKIESNDNPKNKKFIKMNLFDKKNFYDYNIGSPYNTNEYLMNINSTSFWNDENSIKIIPSVIIKLRGETNSELNIFEDKETESNTHENTIEQKNQKKIERNIIER